MSILIPTILSGGAGSRLWPVSRKDFPKPFMKLADGQSLLQKTYHRAAGLPGVYQKDGKPMLLTVTNRDYYFMSRDEVEVVGASGAYILEPFSKNTGPAIAMAANYILDHFGSKALMLVLPADHLIVNQDEFVKSVQEAVMQASAPNNQLVTFGILPTAPEIGFGYIEAGQKIEGGYRIRSFVEKPDLKTAQAYLESGRYFWNSGMFCFSADQFLRQLQLCMPQLADSVKECWADLKNRINEGDAVLEIPDRYFSAIPDISIDYAVMEKSKHVSVIPSNFGWNDIGSWTSVQNLMTPDINFNRASGDVIFINSFNTYVQSESRLVATVGVNNLMIIDTKDALLVINPENTQEVKKVVEVLKDKEHDVYKSHKTITRPWGIYTVLEEGLGFKIKKIEVKPGARLSLQSHNYRSEHWVVVKGRAKILNGASEINILVNQSTYIPAGHKHRLENPADEVLVMIEVQCGEYLGEDDIVRYEDNYGRA
jgi:mannose-1-phosphate guanylyltransferase/mannose-6-phosphate isomerase